MAEEAIFSKDAAFTFHNYFSLVAGSSGIIRQSLKDMEP